MYLYLMMLLPLLLPTITRTAAQQDKPIPTTTVPGQPDFTAICQDTLALLSIPQPKLTLTKDEQSQKDLLNLVAGAGSAFAFWKLLPQLALVHKRVTQPTRMIGIEGPAIAAALKPLAAPFAGFVGMWFVWSKMRNSILEPSELRQKHELEERDRKFEEHKKAIARLMEEHRKKTDESLKEHRDDTKEHAEKQDKLIAEHNKKMEDAQKAHREELNRKHLELEKVVAQHEQAMVNKQKEHAQALQKEQNELAAKMALKQKEHEADVARKQAEQQEMIRAHADKMRALQQEHEDKIKQLQTKHEQRLQEQLAAQQKKLDQQQKEFEATVAKELQTMAREAEQVRTNLVETQSLVDKQLKALQELFTAKLEAMKKENEILRLGLVAQFQKIAESLGGENQELRDKLLKEQEELEQEINKTLAKTQAITSKVTSDLDVLKTKVDDVGITTKLMTGDVSKALPIIQELLKATRGIKESSDMLTKKVREYEEQLRAHVKHIVPLTPLPRFTVPSIPPTPSTAPASSPAPARTPSPASPLLSTLFSPAGSSSSLPPSISVDSLSSPSSSSPVSFSSPAPVPTSPRSTSPSVISTSLSALLVSTLARMGSGTKGSM